MKEKRKVQSTGWTSEGLCWGSPSPQQRWALSMPALVALQQLGLTLFGWDSLGKLFRAYGTALESWSPLHRYTVLLETWLWQAPLQYLREAFLFPRSLGFCLQVHPWMLQALKWCSTAFCGINEEMNRWTGKWRMLSVCISMSCWALPLTRLSCAGCGLTGDGAEWGESPDQPCSDISQFHSINIYVGI